ncbi:uncharacterized protein PAE49_020884 [Odontesthes bonariensis]
MELQADRRSDDMKKLVLGESNTALIHHPPIIHPSSTHHPPIIHPSSTHHPPIIHPSFPHSHDYYGAETVCAYCCCLHPQVSLRRRNVSKCLSDDHKAPCPVSVCPTDGLSVRPNLQQFFPGEPVSLSCEGHMVSDGRPVRTRGTQVESCGAGFGIWNGLSCFLNNYNPNSGVYWCEGGAGERSDWANVTVSGGALILEVPALPVRAGSEVTLRCRQRSRGAVAAYFLFNGRSVEDEPKELLVREVQPSDEGLYMCATDEFGSSPQSLLRVRGPPPTTCPPAPLTSSPPPAASITSPLSPPASSTFVPVVAAVGFPVVLVLVLVLVVALWLRRKRTGTNLSSPPADCTYADVTFRHTAGPIPASQSDVRPLQSVHNTNCTHAVMQQQTEDRPAELGPTVGPKLKEQSVAGGALPPSMTR